MTALETLDYSTDNGIATITMNQPKTRNPFSQQLKDDFETVFLDLRKREDVAAVILRGSDGVFSGGGDLKSLNQSTNQGTVQGRRRIYRTHDWFQIMLNLEVPIIAAVDGPAYGGGFALALGADFVLVSERARMCCVFSRIGLVPDVSTLFTLPRIVGLQKAKEIALTNRTIDAEEAKSLGIAMEIYPAETLYDEAQKLAERLCLASTPAQGLTKRILNQSFNLDASALVEMEASAQSILFQTDYHKEAIRRFVDKEPLEFNWEKMD